MKIESQSSFIESFTYDHEKSTLKIKLRSGKSFTYAEVPVDVFDDMQAADSHGKFYNSTIKGQFPES